MAAQGIGLQPINIVLILCFFKSASTFMDMEELKSIYYGLDILSEPVMMNQDTPSGSVQVTSKYGQQYQCTFPDHSEAEKKKEEEEKVAVETGIVEMLKPMKSQDCLVKTKDWWTYEFCFGKSVRQYHMEDDAVRGNVIHLGFYENDFDWSNDTAKEERLKTTLASYHSQSYTQGDKCDLTGRPRKVEVRFMCEENSEDLLSRIEESETCVYTMTVLTARVCRHPYLRPPVRRRAVPITCNPLLSQAEFNDYMTQVNERKEAASKYRQDQRVKKEEDLKRRKSGMDQDLEDALMKTARDVLSGPKGSLFPEPGEDGKVTKESFQQMFGSNEQLWELYQKGLELSKKSTEEQKKKMEELKALLETDGNGNTVKTEEEDNDIDEEDKEVFSEYYDEIDDIKKRFKRTQKKLSNIRQKLSEENSWEANIEKAIKEAEDELGMKLDRSLVAGLSSTLNKLVNKLQDTEKEMSSMDEEINGLKPGSKTTSTTTDDGDEFTSARKPNNDGETKVEGIDGDDDDDDDDRNKKDAEVESTIVKGDGFDQNSREEWRIEKSHDPSPTTKPSAQKPYDDKIESPPGSTASDQNMDKTLEVPSTFPLPKDPTQDIPAAGDNKNGNTPPPLPTTSQGSSSSADGSSNDEGPFQGNQGGIEDDHQQDDGSGGSDGTDTDGASPDFKLTVDELEDVDEENKIPPDIKELLEETVRKEYEKKISRKSSGKLGLDDDHSFIHDKSIHVIQQEDKDGNTNKFIFVLGFKNMDEEVVEENRQTAMEENYEFVYNSRGVKNDGGAGGGGDGSMAILMEQEEEGGDSEQQDLTVQPAR